MANLEKIYELTIENNTNIKHLMGDHKEMKSELDRQELRITKIEHVGKKTVKEHLISFGKVCAAFLTIGGAYKLFMLLAENVWR